MRALACHGAFLILTSKPVTLGRSSNSSVFLSSLTLEVSIRFAKCLSENAVTIHVRMWRSRYPANTLWRFPGRNRASYLKLGK